MSNSKGKFNGILIGQEKYTLSPQKLEYEHKLKSKSKDSTIYSFDFQDVTGQGVEKTEMLFTKDQLFIGWSHTEIGAYDYQFQKLMDFGLKSGDKWAVKNLFCYPKSTIIFESKYLDKILNDTVYQFRIDAGYHCSHTDPAKRIYGTKKLGLVRVDYSLEPSLNPNKYDRAIFVSDDYLKRGELKRVYRDGLIKDTR